MSQDAPAPGRPRWLPRPSLWWRRWDGLTTASDVCRSFRDWHSEDADNQVSSVLGVPIVGVQFGTRRCRLLPAVACSTPCPPCPGRMAGFPELRSPPRQGDRDRFRPPVVDDGKWQ